MRAIWRALARMWGWAGDRCWDASEWCVRRSARRQHHLLDLTALALVLLALCGILWVLAQSGAGDAR